VKSKKEVTKKALIPGLLIDPFKQEIAVIKIANDPNVWRKVLRCDWFDCMCISAPTKYDNRMDIWFDDEGRLSEQPLPRFKLKRGQSVGGGEYDFCGYGLILSSDDFGDTIGLNSDPFSLAAWTDMCGLAFERTAGNPRFEGKDAEFLEQKMRLIENELPGEFEQIAHGQFVSLEEEE
jgi:hypothetical protein